MTVNITIYENENKECEEPGPVTVDTDVVIDVFADVLESFTTKLDARRDEDGEVSVDDLIAAFKDTVGAVMEELQDAAGELQVEEAQRCRSRDRPTPKGI